ncbi:hypothetical protein A3862_04640 [Methylobacterium sp. XJLW]|uniref:hypothetical protein n=1 Tax=Methylobacterium sp. XJLW TaxID=739141 RepID=UPI000DAB01D4|nr:hypothetical protein [Methylobacterium sp. XJLW]AWV14879.1 hypothetical protein A3862_04640 [Methylobacterium sp. XJLW]
MSSSTPITDRIAEQVAAILEARGQALVQVNRPALDIAAVNRHVGPDYRVEERLGSLRLIRVDIDRMVEKLDAAMTPRMIYMLADIHARGVRMGQSREWDRHRDAAVAAGERGPRVMPPGWTPPKSRTRKAVEAEAPAAGPSL